MSPSQFFQTYLQLQKDIMFDELIDVGFATICFSKNDPSPFWNNALTTSVLSSSQLEIIEDKLQSLNRKPAVYFENSSNLKSLSDLLSQRGYSQAAEDSIMFHNGENINPERFSSIRKVATETDLDTFIDTFDRCYVKDDPLNPYGELGEYLVAAREAWKKHHDAGKIEYFTAYENEAPVAVGTLTNYGNVGYISNVGSLLSVRGKGFGKLVTLYCVHKSKENGNTDHCLATEEGTNSNSFYRAIGFKTKFTSKLMVKN